MSSVIEDFTCLYSLNYMYPKVELKMTKNQLKHVQINSDYQGIYK